MREFNLGVGPHVSIVLACDANFAVGGEEELGGGCKPPII